MEEGFAYVEEFASCPSASSRQNAVGEVAEGAHPARQDEKQGVIATEMKRFYHLLACPIYYVVYLEAEILALIRVNLELERENFELKQENLRLRQMIIRAHIPDEALP